MLPTKQELHILCQTYLDEQEHAIKKIIADAQEAANNETKSTAGDKYETAREMMQQEINLALSRLNELQKQRAALVRIDAGQTNTMAAPGALVYTTAGNYYVAISAGRLSVAGETFYAISPASPLGMQLAGSGVGSELVLNGRKIGVIRIC